MNNKEAIDELRFLCMNARMKAWLANASWIYRDSYNLEYHPTGDTWDYVSDIDALAKRIWNLIKYYVPNQRVNLAEIWTIATRITKIIEIELRQFRENPADELDKITIEYLNECLNMYKEIENKTNPKTCSKEMGYEINGPRVTVTKKETK